MDETQNPRSFFTESQFFEENHSGNAVLEWITEQNNRKSLFKKLSIPCLQCGKMGRWGQRLYSKSKTKSDSTLIIRKKEFNIQYFNLCNSSYKLSYQHHLNFLLGKRGDDKHSTTSKYISLSVLIVEYPSMICPFILFTNHFMYNIRMQQMDIYLRSTIQPKNMKIARRRPFTEQRDFLCFYTIRYFKKCLINRVRIFYDLEVMGVQDTTPSEYAIVVNELRIRSGHVYGLIYDKRRQISETMTLMNMMLKRTDIGTIMLWYLPNFVRITHPTLNIQQRAISINYNIIKNDHPTTHPKFNLTHVQAASRNVSMVRILSNSFHTYTENNYQAYYPTFSPNRNSQTNIFPNGILTKSPNTKATVNPPKSFILDHFALLYSNKIITIQDIGKRLDEA
ncbi:hypothetical protein AGLY_006342 [Aphis glycines]|uniref:Uncharacterized protein n=1 Tax=Aphis glycines TaxID=307491 RepID=A0A6G0TRN7_APHGL|nr:hypothetical protein AGLY_006342 [Aphis glycines]